MKMDSVLFDLDGTFADTSVDMCNALNIVLRKNNFKIVDCAGLKTHISKGAIGIIEYASQINGRPIDSSLLRAQFLQEYSENTFVYTKTIDGIDQVLEYFKKNNIKWGIVTNKHSKYAKKILFGLNLTKKCECLITGDMLEDAKPSPEGLLLAAKNMSIDVKNSVYIGDDSRDILAGKKAGMYTIAANFGFVNNEEDINTWGADKIICDPKELKKLIT